MDTYEEIEYVNLDSFSIQTDFYEEYQGGVKISSGKCNCQIVCENEYNKELKFSIIDNPTEDKIESNFEFDATLTVKDRLLMFILPSTTNVKNLTQQMLASSGYKNTRRSKTYTPTEPIIGCIFTQNGEIVKISFTMGNPERLIEYSVKQKETKQYDINPYNITEDPTLCRIHQIPGAQFYMVFRDELGPQIMDAGNDERAILRVSSKYFRDMIKSYYENAGVVPMSIVDTVTNCIQQVIENFYGKILILKGTSLKEFFLSQILE